MAAGPEAVRMAQRGVALHGPAQADVVRVPGIGAAIAVENDPAFLHAILVGPLASFDDRSGSDRQRHVGQDRRLEDALRPAEGHPRAVEVEAPAPGLPREDLAPRTGRLPRG